MMRRMPTIVVTRACVVSIGTILALCSSARAMVIAGATGPNFNESTVTPVTTSGQPDNLLGVGYYKTADGLFIRTCSGVMLDAQHVLTAAHCFFPGGDGIGKQVPNPTQFVLPEFNQPFQVASVTLHPNYDPTKGHRVAIGGPAREAFDLAIITLAAPIPNAKYYTVNSGQIADERNPDLTTLKVGFGLAGNGTGSVGGTAGTKRFMLNTVDQYGDGKTTWNIGGNRNNPPPINTLVYDFDDPAAGAAGSSNLKNFVDAKRNGAVAPVMINGKPIEYEGSPAGGDSGGPMFQRVDGNSPWYLVGITSSGSDSMSAFGNVAYDTRLNTPANLAFIKAFVFAPEPSTLALLSVGACVLLGSSRLRRAARLKTAC